jgi:hypothetical protein
VTEIDFIARIVDSTRLLLLSEVARVIRTITSASLLAFTVGGVFGQSATERPAYEVASVKPNKSGTAPIRFVGSRGGITATNVTLQFLIMNAYGVRDNQISGGPSWLTSERYDVVAKDQSDSPSPAKQMQMLQTLLADRFQLRLRRETKELPVCAGCRKERAQISRSRRRKRREKYDRERSDYCAKSFNGVAC